MERTEERAAAANVRIGGKGMPRDKKDAKNFGCKFDREIFENLEKMREFSKQL